MMISGDCFQAAAKFVMGGTRDEPLTLVHGTVEGTGSIIGIRYCHAWAELDGYVYEVANERCDRIWANLYYRLGRVKHVRHYTVAEILVETLRTGHWGPWDPVFDSFRGMP
jgi:hypothetical protein